METRIFTKSNQNRYLLTKQCTDRIDQAGNGNYTANLYKILPDGTFSEPLITKTRGLSRGQTYIRRESLNTFSEITKGKLATAFKISERIPSGDTFTLEGVSHSNKHINIKKFELPENKLSTFQLEQLSPLAKKYIRAIGKMFINVR